MYTISIYEANTSDPSQFPRKKLGYKTPYEVFSYICNRVALDTGMCGKINAYE